MLYGWQYTSLCEYKYTQVCMVFLGPTWKVMRSISVQEKSYNRHSFPSTPLRENKSVHIYNTSQLRSKLILKVSENLFTSTKLFMNYSIPQLYENYLTCRRILPDKYGPLSLPHQKGLNFSALFSPARKRTDGGSRV